MYAQPSISNRFRINVDQSSGSEPCLNEHGWPANEITLLLKLQSKGEGDSSLARSLESKLIDLPSPQVDNSGLSNREIIDGIIPRHCQTLGEYLKYLDSLPLSAAERQMLEEQAKDQFSGEDEDVKTKSDDSSDSPS